MNNSEQTSSRLSQDRSIPSSLRALQCEWEKRKRDVLTKKKSSAPPPNLFTRRRSDHKAAQPHRYDEVPPMRLDIASSLVHQTSPSVVSSPPSPIELPTPDAITEQLTPQCDRCIVVGRRSDAVEESTSFRWTHGGNHVRLIGSFNNWSALIPMRRNHSQQWHEVELLLPPGHHEYKYVVDHQWCCDETKPTIPVPGFADQCNNVIHIGGDTDDHY